MEIIHYWVNKIQRWPFKLAILLFISYLFLGISEGTFFWFEDGFDALLNFLFTVFCVGSNWILFRKLFWSSQQKVLSIIHQSLQYLTIVIFHLGFTTLLNWFYIEILWKESLLDTGYFSTVLPLATMLFVAWILVNHWLHQFYKKDSKPKTKKMRIEGKKGQKTVLVDVENVIGFSLENRVVFMVNSNEERFILDKNLSTIETEMLDFGFFRVNRQLIVQKAAILSYKTISNEKIEISLKIPFNKSRHHIVSRYKAPGFRKWVNSPTI